MPPLRLCLGLLACTFALGAPAVAAPEPRVVAAPAALIPGADPAYDALWQLAAWGMPLRRFAAFPGLRYTRYEYTVALRLTLLDLGGAEGVRTSFPADLRFRAVRLFRSLIDEFAPELASLGLDLEPLRAEFDAASRRTTPDTLPALRRWLPTRPLTQRLVLRELWQPPVLLAPATFTPRPTHRLPHDSWRTELPPAPPPPRAFRPRPATAPLLGLLPESALLTSRCWTNLEGWP